MRNASSLGGWLLMTTLMSSPVYAQIRSSDKTDMANSVENTKKTPIKKSADTEDITVFASKQNKGTSNFNGSVSVASAQRLRDAQVYDTSALGRVFADLNIAQTSNILYPTISLRGAGSAVDFYNPAVTVYVDGVPQLPGQSIQMLNNIQQVELLRGAQATLYGRGAEGGIIDIVTQKPGPKFDANLGAGAASRNGYNAEGGMSGTLIRDWLYGSISGKSIDQPGNFKNPSTGRKNLGGGNEHGGTARLRLAPKGAAWSVEAAADGSCADTTQVAYVPFNDIASRRFDAVAGTPNPDAGRCNHNESLSFDYNFGHWKLSGTAAWQDLDLHNLFPYYSYFARQHEQWHSNFQEIKASTVGKGNPVDGVLGFYHQTIDQNRQAATDQYVPYYYAAPSTISSSDSDSIAVYLNATWHITPRLDLTGGARYSHDSAHLKMNSPYYGAIHSSTTGDLGLGEGSLAYQIMQGWRAYFRIAEGYKPVGFNRGPSTQADAVPFKAEHSLNYELGTTVQSGQFSGRFALFYSDTSNMQLYTGLLGFQHLSNVARTHVEGLEAEFGADILDHWRVSLQGNVIKSVFDKYNDGTTEGLAYNHNNVPFVPAFTALGHLEGSYDLPFGKLKPGVDLRVTGQQYFDIANSLKQNRYMTVDMHLSYFPKPDTEITFYINNINDKLYRTYAFQGPVGGLAQINFGRTIGGDVRIHFR